MTITLRQPNQDVRVHQDVHARSSYRCSRRNSSGGMFVAVTPWSMNRWRASSRLAMVAEFAGAVANSGWTSTDRTASTGKSTGSSGTMTVPSKCARMVMTKHRTDKPVKIQGWRANASLAPGQWPGFGDRARGEGEVFVDGGFVRRRPLVV